MYKSFLSLLTAVVALAGIAIAPVHAGGGHDHGPRYGGVVREVKGVSYELVARPDSLTLYVSDHGKPISTAGAAAVAVLYAGSDKTTVQLESAGENTLQAKGEFKVGVGVRVALTATFPGNKVVRTTFNLK